MFLHLYISISVNNSSLKYPIIMKYLRHLLLCAIKFILQHSLSLNHRLKFSITSRINCDIYGHISRDIIQESVPAAAAAAAAHYTPQYSNISACFHSNEKIFYFNKKFQQFCNPAKISVMG